MLEGWKHPDGYIIQWTSQDCQKKFSAQNPVGTPGVQGASLDSWGPGEENKISLQEMADT